MKKETVIMPQINEILVKMGEQIRMARLRRNLSVKLVCERAFVSRKTLWQIEKGSSSVSIGSYAAVLNALNGLDKDLLLIAKDDELGRKLVEIEIANRKRIRNN